MDAMMGIKEILWRLDYCRIFHNRAGGTLAFAWYAAKAAEYDPEDMYTPAEAVEEELSCWTDDE